MKLAKTYNPNEYEPNIYAMWESAGVFRPRGEGTPYSIVMPPPNANGNLHVGHALGSALQDILVRYHRMKGDDAVFIPGADHAGFETWVVYERELEKQGKTRFDYSRDELYTQVWNFVDQKRGDMELQLRALGVGADWEDMVFTLDPKVVETVYGTFNKLWQDGLIYRGERIVNYCTKHQTSFADIEVVHKTEKSKLWRIAYPLLDHIGEIIVATTRPETLLGDTAIAVNPADERYKKLIGTKALLPLVGREIPIIADEYVDASYGTGAVKITPAHDPNDFEMGQRHGLPVEQVIGFDGRMTNVPAPFDGLTTTEARPRGLGAQSVLVAPELTVELLGDLGRGGHVHDGVEALGLLLDVVGQPALAPDVDLVHGAPVAGDDLQQLLERRVGGALVRLGVEDDHDLVVTHAWYPPPLVCGGHGPSVTGG